MSLGTHDTEQAQQVVSEHRAAKASPGESSPLRRLGGEIGNRGVGQLIARMGDGEGIMSSGVVHPDVQASIAGAQGQGKPLDRGSSERLENSMGSLDDVRVHTGAHAAALARAVSARAFTVGSDIFFAQGEYRPGTRTGNELIAHEAAHAVQQRDAPASGPLVVSQPGDAMEREAEAVARDVSD